MKTSLFDVLPVVHEVPTDLGPHPVPYTVSEGHTVLVTGTGDLKAIEQATKAEDIHPVQTRSGQAALGLFLCRFDVANSGPHLEYHLGILAAPEPGEIISDTPEAFLAALAARPDWSFLSLDLRNDTAEVVALNTSYFGLAAQKMSGSIIVDPDQVRVDLIAVSGEPLAKGQIKRRRQPEMRSLWHIARLMGWRNFLAATRNPQALGRGLCYESQMR